MLSTKMSHFSAPSISALQLEQHKTMHKPTKETQSLVYIRIFVPLSCISVSISASIPISVPVSVSFPVLVSFSISVSVPVSAVVVVVAVMIVCRIVIRVVCPWWNMRVMRVMPVLSVAFIVLLLIVFPDVWLAVPTVMLVVVVVMLVVAVMMVVIMAPVVIASLLLVLLHHIFHLVIPLLMQVPAWKPLAIIPARLYFQATRCLVVLGVAVVLHPAVMMVMVMVVGVLGSLWFSPQEALFLFFLALCSPLFLCWG